MKLFSLKPLTLLVLSLCFALQAFAAPDYWVDVRTPQEFQQSHVMDANLIPYEEIKEKIATVTKDKHAEIYLYCASGHRAAIALEALTSMGYTKVKNIGGISDALKLEQSTKP